MTDREFTRQYRIHQWAAAIQDQKTSGLTIAQWCDEHEVSRYQFFYRQKVVRKALADSRNWMKALVYEGSGFTLLYYRINENCGRFH